MQMVAEPELTRTRIGAVRIRQNGISAVTAAGATLGFRDVIWTFRTFEFT